MPAFNLERLSVLLADRAAIFQQIRVLRDRRDDLTDEYNEFIEEMRGSTGSRRSHLHRKAQNAHEAKMAIRPQEKALQGRLEAKEKEIVDFIAAMWAASELLLGAERQHDLLRKGVDDLGARLSALETRVGALTDAIGALRSGQAGQAGAVKAIGTRIDRLAGEVANARVTFRAVEGTVAQITNAVEPTVERRGWNPDFQPVSEPCSRAIPEAELDALPERVTVLLFASHVPKETTVDVAEEAREIEMKINDATLAAYVRLKAWQATRPLDLMPMFNRHKPYMVHFSGHGQPGALIMTGGPDRPEPVPTDLLVRMFKASADHLRVAFFNVCDSEEQAVAAARLLDVVIGMRGRLPDTMARMFAARVYSSLAFGESMRKAFEQGLLEVEKFPEARVVPQLYHRPGVDPHKVVLVRPRQRD
ncbi:hypothetical protein ACTMTJ_04390 [Phytohabitans sp. LJ34]|uniref:hypothetical protein n=1 Tax=Phytohabitans sp. LJ34 TaxID=3452217 RepID=UPI003F8CCE06